MERETNSTSPPPLRTSGSSRSWFRQRRQYQRGEATPLVNSAGSSQTASPGSFQNLLFQRYRAGPSLRAAQYDHRPARPFDLGNGLPERLDPLVFGRDVLVGV